MGAQYLGKTATLVPSRWSFARRHMLGTGELMWTSVKRVGTRRINPSLAQHQTPGPFLVSRHPLSEGRPLLAVSGSSRGWPAPVSSSHTWEARCGLPLRGHK